MAGVVVGIYLLGILVSMSVYSSRAGEGWFWHTYRSIVLTPRMWRPAGPWLLKQIGKIYAWPIVLVVWLASGKPEAPNFERDVIATS